MRFLAPLVMMSVVPASALASERAIDCSAERLSVKEEVRGNATGFYARGMEALRQDDFAEADRQFRQAYVAAGSVSPPADAAALELVAVARLTETSLQLALRGDDEELRTAYFRLAALRRLAKAGPLPPWVEQLMLMADERTADVALHPGTIAALTECKGRGFGVDPSINVRVLFNYDSSEISTAGKAQLVKVSMLLAGSGLQRVIVRGHTDRHGSHDYNMALSMRRAQVVVRTLVALEPGLQDRLTAEGRGDRELLHAGEDEKADQLNRRVEFVLITKQ